MLLGHVCGKGHLFAGPGLIDRKNLFLTQQAWCSSLTWPKMDSENHLGGESEKVNPDTKCHDE